MKDDQDLASSLLAHDEDVAVPADHERRIREGLAALLGGGAPPAPSNPTTPSNGAAQSALRKWATTAVVAAAAAGGGFVAGRVTSPPAAPPQPVVVAPPPAPAASSPSAPSAEPVASSAPSASTSATAPPTAVPAALGADAFDREQSLLERARSALVRHDADAAQKALDEHDRQFPRSRHAEERDYLRIQVLRERGDGARVRERAKAFLAKYPDSMLRARVEPLAE